MNIEFKKKYELYQNGNFVDSFDTEEEMRKFFEKESHKYENPIWQLNYRKYSIMEAKHAVFS